MNSNLYYNILIVCLITHAIRLIYEILKHKKIIIPDKLSFIIIFINMALLWMSWIVLCSLDPLKIELPEIARYTGITLTATGLVIFLTALFTIKTLETYSGDLITTGIYSKIRHPMYLAFIMWLVGFPLFYEAGASLILAIIFIANVLFWKHLEEIELMHRFPAYSEYRKRSYF